MHYAHLPIKQTLQTDETSKAFYAAISHNWQYRARQLQYRRWQALRHSYDRETVDLR
jgi:hypothetical protein